jgi:UDP-glucose 4-epimerase
MPLMALVPPVAFPRGRGIGSDCRVAAVAVTGAAGYVGSRLVTEWADQPVTALVRKQVPYLPADCQVEVDLLGDAGGLATALDGVTAVVHLAGHNETVAAQEPDRALTETALIARRLSEAARLAGVARLVYVSTIHVYGERIQDGAVITEDLAPEPRSTYAISRLTAEHLLAQADVELVVLRLTNAVGAPADPTVDRWTLVASELCRQAALGQPLVLRTPGLQWRDFVSLSDVCRIVRSCAQLGRITPGVYNLGSGTSHTVRALAELVQERLDAHTGRRPELLAPPPEGLPPRPYSVAVERLAAQGCHAEMAAAEAVDELVRFCLAHKDDL